MGVDLITCVLITCVHGLHYIGDKLTRVAFWLTDTGLFVADLDLPYTYLGADDHAGPNYTGQPAINSHYTKR